MNRAIILGGSGALGRAVVNAFGKGWEAVSIDYSENTAAKKNIVLSLGASTYQNVQTCQSSLQGKFQAIVTVAGGFMAGDIKDPNVFEQMQKCLEINLYSALVASHLATNLLDNKGLLLFTGAAAPFEGTTPGLLAYGISKVGVHSLALNMATRNALPADSTVLTILPVTIDTPMNREAMPDADFSKWSQPSQIAALIRMWAEGENKPNNGSFAKLEAENGHVIPKFL